MRERVWLASYPKSGNTWFRILLGCLSLNEGETIDINELRERGDIASARGPFEYVTQLGSELLTHDEIDELRPRVYESLWQYLAEARPEAEPHTSSVQFVKVHDAYTLTASGEPLLAGARGGKCAILIVRDPRDVAPSLANHNRTSIEVAIKQLNDATTQYCARPDRQHLQLRQKLLDWSGHVASWLDQSDIPVHLVRYEDLLADTATVLSKALAFAGQPASETSVARAVRLANFAQLQAQEVARGFSELPKPHLGGRFFRRGEAGAWREELTAEQVQRIESIHGTMMMRLNYGLSGPIRVVQTS